MTSAPLDSSTSKIDSGGLTQPLIPNSDSSLQEPLSDSSTLSENLTRYGTEDDSKIANYEAYKKLDSRMMSYLLPALGMVSIPFLAIMFILFLASVSSPKVPELDGSGNPVLDPFGKPVMVSAGITSETLSTLDKILLGIFSGIGLLGLACAKKAYSLNKEAGKLKEEHKEDIQEILKFVEEQEKQKREQSKQSTGYVVLDTVGTGFKIVASIVTVLK